MNLYLEMEHRVIYANVLGKRLSERVKELGEQASECSLNSEIALARLMLADAIQASEASIDLAAEAGCTPDQLKLVTMKSRELIYAALDKVIACVTAHKRVTAEGGALDVTAMQTVVLQMVATFDQQIQKIAPVLEQGGVDPHEFMNVTSTRMTEQLRLPRGYDGSSYEPNHGFDYTSLDPDVEAAAMDATVPAEPESQPHTNGYHNGAA